MASNWSQGGQYAGAGARPYDKGSTARAYERPPTCFNCGEEGHFVVNCPRSKQSAPVGHPANLQGAAAQNSNSPLYGSQQSAYNNGSSYSAPPNTAPGTIVPGYSPPGQPPQQYQQFAPPPNQQYAPHSTAPQAQAPYSHYSQNHSYNGSQQPYSQPYNSPAGPPQQQYAYQGGYQAQPQAYGQYSQSPAPQQYSTPAYQPPPQPYAQSQTPYQAQPTLYQPPNGGGYEQNYNYGTPVPQNPTHPSQWSHTPPQVQPYTTPPYPSQTQYNAGYQGQYDQNGPYPPQQHQNSYATDDYEYQQSAQDSAYGADQNQQAPAYPYQVPPVEQQYVPGHPEQSMESSAASTPYASRRGSLASSQGGQECSTQNLQFSTQRNSNSLSEEDQQFNWDFKKIFKEDSHQEALPINRPLPNAFEDDTSSLYSNYPSDSASQYTAKSREKEFKQSIRQSYHWPSMQQDPVFSDIKHGAPLIPLDQLSSWMEERHESLALTDTSNDHKHSDGSRKRTWSDEQADVDNQISQEAFAEYKASSPSIKRQKTDALPRITTSYGNEESANTGPGTPVFARAGTPSFGAEDDVWAPQAGESQDPTEAKLAALGVSGAPKPVQPMDPVPLPPDFNSHLGYNLPPRRQDSGYVSANGSYNNISQPSQYNGYQPNYDTQWQSQPPPPPPPPPPQENPPRKPDRPSSTLSPQDETQDNAQSQPSNGVQHNGTSTTPTPVDIVSPQVPQPRRKIVRVISGKKTEPLRQEDDVTPKFKRSQPVVAEAYSRRW